MMGDRTMSERPRIDPQRLVDRVLAEAYLEIKRDSRSDSRPGDDPDHDRASDG